MILVFRDTAVDSITQAYHKERGIVANKIPEAITQQHILAALGELDRGVAHAFADSTGYDVLYQGRRYPPKAVIGVAAGNVLGEPLGPYDFKGGLKSKCFRILARNGFTIVTKADTHPFPDEIDKAEHYTEGGVQRVIVNRYERDADARRKAIEHYGARCQVCGFDFEVVYGAIGEGFIHVHHTVLLSQIGKSYVVDPVNDLKPVCPNCHAMLHKRLPPYTIDELRDIMKAARNSIIRTS